MEAWEQFLAQQERLLGKETFTKWLSTLKVVRFDALNLYLEAKDSFQILWFDEHIRPKAEKFLVNNNQKKIKVHLTLSSSNTPVKKGKSESKDIKKEFSLDFDLLDPSQTFDHFVSTDGNILAFKLLTKLAHDQNDLNSFNPIYLHGNSGCGKTHLLMAAAHSLKERGLNIEYVRAETFTGHLVKAIQSGEMSRFRQAYRSLDALIIDNVHHFAKKGATQEEFFHTFNTLHLAGKQIILAANSSPSQLHAIEPRLVSRFEWGIVLPLESPSRKELVAIVQKKASALSAPLTASVADFLAETFSVNSSHLIQALQALMIRTQGNKHPWTVSFAEHHLKDLIEIENKVAITPEIVVETIADHFGILQEDILGKGQARECALPRQLAMYIMREHLNKPFAKIGDFFGRDHSTVMTSCKAIQKGLDTQDLKIAPPYREILKIMDKECTTKSRTV